MLQGQVQNVSVTNPLTGTSLVLSWSAFVAPGIVGYNVKRALSKEGPYTQLNLTPVTSTTFTDSTALQQSRTNYWYVVTATNGTDETVTSSPIVNIVLGKQEDRTTLTTLGASGEMMHARIAREMVRRDALMLRRGGEPMDVYVRKTTGPKCSACYVPQRNQPAKATCPTCFGTSYEGGYEKYPNVKIKVEPMTTRLELGTEGIHLTSNPRAWTGTFPIVNDGDIIVRRLNNKRYELQGLDTIMTAGILVRQAFTINELIKSEAPQIFMLS